mmetsp:Transcript_19515/g.30536  ORF Transcript_19515/g.30536 Transcript_19515/m.30536 type:complete len:106 (+) Transcript_19515:692-1009(+)
MMSGSIGNFTDVYGVGACLLWILSGRTPASQTFFADGKRSRSQISECLALGLKDLDTTGLSIGLEAALAEDFRKRTQTVDELLRVVESWGQETLDSNPSTEILNL